MVMSVSLSKSAAFWSAMAWAFLVWWSSATLGEGTKITGLPTTASSLTELAPAREIITSAMEKAALMSSTKGRIRTLSLCKCLYSGK